MEKKMQNVLNIVSSPVRKGLVSKIKFTCNPRTKLAEVQKHDLAHVLIRLSAAGETNLQNRLLAYQQYIALVCSTEKEMRLAIAETADEIWHTHMFLDSQVYVDFSYNLYGEYIHHKPDTMIEDSLLVQGWENTMLAFTEAFGKNPDPSIWNYAVCMGNGGG